MSVASFLFSQAKEKQKVKDDKYLNVDIGSYFDLEPVQQIHESNEGVSFL